VTHTGADRMGASDNIFSEADAAYLNHTFLQSRGIRFVPEGKLFFQQEFPEIIAQEADRLWHDSEPHLGLEIGHGTSPRR
jgi:hypothetical protein